MTPQDIADLAEMWRAENPGNRAFAVLTLDHETTATAMQTQATGEEFMVMLLTLFSSDHLYHTAAKAAIEMFKQPHIQQMLMDRYFDTDKGITPKNIKS